MAIKSKIFLLVMTVMMLVRVNGQDAHFSQFYANPLYLNPAFAGSKVCPRLIMNYRNQWPAIPGSYVTYNASFDMHFNALSGGLGVLVYSDRAGEGVLTTNSASLIYSARIRLTKEIALKAGFQAGYFQKSIDFSRLTFGDQIDPQWGFIYHTNQPPINEKVSNVDFASGLLLYSKLFYVGFASHHLVEVNESFIEPNGFSLLSRRYTGHIGGNIGLTSRGFKKIKPTDPVLSPNLVYMQQGDFHQLNYGLYFKKQPMIFGLWYRHFFEGSDAVIALIGFEYDKFKFGYSYDITVSKLAPSSGGAHEFSFALDFNCPVKRIKIHEISCPSF